MSRWARLAILVVLAAATAVARWPADAVYGWMGSYVGRPAHELANDPLFDGVARLLAPNAEPQLGQGRDRSFAAALEQEMRNSDQPVRLSDKRYLTVEGYRADGGVAQMLLWVDLDQDRALGALFANWGGSDPEIWVFSRREPAVSDPAQLPAPFFTALEQWQRERHLPEFLPTQFFGVDGRRMLLHPLLECATLYAGDAGEQERCAAGDRSAAELDLVSALRVACRCTAALPPEWQDRQDAWRTQLITTCASSADPLCIARGVHARAAALLAEAPQPVLAVSAPPGMVPQPNGGNGFRDVRAGVSFRTPPGWTATKQGDTVSLVSPGAAVTIQVTSEMDAAYSAAARDLVADACRALQACAADGEAHAASLDDVPTLSAAGEAQFDGAAVQWRADLVQANVPVLVLTYGTTDAVVGEAAAIGAFQRSFALIGGSTTPPHAIFAPDAQYSDEARQAHIEGAVTLAIDIDAQGDVTEVRIVNGLGYGLDEVAIAAVRQWRFQPATRNGQPVGGHAQVRMTFHLGGR